ncbi:MAG: NADP-dependent malic enzyme, partial [Chitinophagaceae bacterium]|nr:NADP-dependent malic enzyme [Chitinophagaceae bacterium]
RVVFADADNIKILKAAQLVFDEGVAYPILLGNVKNISAIAAANNIELSGFPIIDPADEESEEKRNEYGSLFFEKRKRKGFNYYESKKIMRDRNYYGSMMVETGDADAMISGLSKNYPETIRPALQIIGKEEQVQKIAGMYIVITKKGPLFLADTTINFNPTAEEVADIAILAAREVRHFNITPRIAMLSYSNFGSSNSPEAELMAKATAIVKQRRPDLIVDGELQASMAFNSEILKENYPFSQLVDHEVNTLIFPNLAAGNIAYNLLKEVGGAEIIGPILLGLKKPVHVLQLGSSVRSIINMTLIAVIDAQMQIKNDTGKVEIKNDIEKEINKSSWWKRRSKS